MIAVDEQKIETFIVILRGIHLSSRSASDECFKIYSKLAHLDFAVSHVKGQVHDFVLCLTFDGICEPFNIQSF